MDVMAEPVSYKGLFNRQAKGSTLPPVKVTIERGRIQFFARVIGEEDPIHNDVEAARAKGYPDIVAPASFFTVVDAMVGEELARRGREPLASVIGCDFRFLLHGDDTYQYSGDIFAGDEITAETLVVDFYDKKGGAMEFVTLKSTLSHAERGVVLTATRTLLHRLA